MKLLFKIGMGGNGDLIQWLIRGLLLAIIFILFYNIYSINPFFVQISGGILFIVSVLISEEKLAATQDHLLIIRSYGFNLIEIKKRLTIKDIKRVEILDNDYSLALNIMAFILPYMSGSAANINELIIVFKNGDVKKYITPICIKNLFLFQEKIQEVITEKNKLNSFSQPNYKED
jgi:hypothetical protein